MAEDTSNNSDKGESKGIPDPEVREDQPKRRRNLTVKYKLQILKEVEACRGNSGAVGALLRREGLYSSHISAWKKERDDGLLSIESEIKRGRRAKMLPIEEENQRLREELARTQLERDQAYRIIEAQKKIAALFDASSQQEQSGQEPKKRH